MKKILTLLISLAIVLSFVSCRSNDVNDVPKDFDFSLSWSCNGDSLYNSRSGKLVKQKIATDLESYTTTFFMTDEQKAEIYRLIVDMKPFSYPDEYNPIIGCTTPSREIILSIMMNGRTKTITCHDVALIDTPKGKKGEKFMKVHDAIVDIIENSDEWAALPDYEFYYE